MSPILPRTLRQALLSVLALATCLALPSASHAGSYWWNGTPAAGSNGFSWSSADAPYWNPWGGHCESRGATIPAGNPCTLTWYVPAGLDAQAGAISGTLRQANAAFEQRMFVEANGTTVLQGTSTVQSFNRQWPDMGNYLSISLLTPAAATAVSAGSQYFTADSMSILLVDGSTPALNLLAGHGGWHGPGGACVRYGFTDGGSGIEHVQLAGVDTGVVHDAPSFATGAITTGVSQTDRTPCIAAPGSGTFTYRASASDKSGNAVEQRFTIAFDATPPSLGDLQLNGTRLDDGRRITGSGSGYRPTISFAPTDAHSGIASRQLLLDGRVVVDGVSFTPGEDLTPGSHTVTFRSTDAVGNIATSTRTFVVVDDVAPLATIGSPGTTGDSEPVLDVSASDDLSGLDVTSWTVRVNGRVLVATSATHRLQADVGYLVDGTHEIEVTIADRAGNVARTSIEYRADSGDDLPDPPGLSGLYVTSAPSRVEAGSTHHIRAIAVRDGRPVLGRVELRAGVLVVGSADVQRSGAVDVEAMIDVAGPLTLHPPADSDLEPVELTYEFVAPAPPASGDGDGDGGDGSASGGGGSGTGTGTGSGAPGAGGGGSTTSTTNVTNPAPDTALAPPSSGYPRNVVYYVGNVPFWNGIPLAESGAKLDRVAPRWTLTLVREQPGTVRRLRRVALRLWTNEMTVLTLSPTGATRRVTVNPRRTWRTVHVPVGARTKLGRSLARLRPGAVLTVRLRVVATDKNENRTHPRLVTFRVRA